MAARAEERARRGLIARALLGAALLALAGAAHAGSLRFCDRPAPTTASEQDRILRFAAIVRRELEATGEPVALVSRSGTDLRRFGQRYSHAGVSLKDGPFAPWSVRQLYFACDERRPRLYDEGLAGFVFGMNDAQASWLSIVSLPPDAGEALATAARDDRRAMRLLAPHYSANAFAFADRYQNCNQWVAELFATAWGDAQADRSAAQAWLRAEGYEPTRFEFAGPMLLAVAFVPWLHRDDHPDEDLAAPRFRVSMPASLEAFALARYPQARRVELCRAGGRVVIRRGRISIDDGCTPAEGDEVLTLD